jgi:hypothetical protein
MTRPSLILLTVTLLLRLPSPPWYVVPCSHSSLLTSFICQEYLFNQPLTASRPKEFKTFWHQINELLVHIDDVPSLWKKFLVDITVRLLPSHVSLC